MRKILITFAVLVAGIAAVLGTWIFGGHQLSLFIDRFGTIETISAAINFIAYEGNGTGGIFIVNGVGLSLNDPTPKISPSIGSTKNDQFALASGGKVFAFGPVVSTSTPENAEVRLATVPPAGDNASLAIRRSVLSWPTPFDLNFMTGRSPSWKRHMYYQLRLKKASGETLEMLWRYEQYFYPGNGWGSGFMTREGSTGLIRVDLHL